jgi:cellulose synthase/poly-beta-1,6-N-acetylglucosamine synthase-like glycosyltransferase
VLTGNLAVRRAAFEAVGGFDETLTRCEDVAFGWSLGRAGFTLGYVADAQLEYRHRPGIRSMLRQHYAYGRGMSEVVRKYGLPSEGGRSGSGLLGSLKPNGQRAEQRTLGGLLRRAALGAGRVRGLVAR